MKRLTRNFLITGLACMCAGAWNYGHTTPEDMDLNPDRVVVAEAPTQCLNGGDLGVILMPPGWECGPVPVGGYMPGDFVAVPGRGAFLVTGQILDLVAKYFRPSDHRWAIRMMACESEFDVRADNLKGYLGLTQMPRREFPGRERRAIKAWADKGVTWAGRGVFDAESHIATAAWWRDANAKGRGDWQCKGRG